MAKNRKHSTATESVNLITLFNKTSPISEQYRTIRTNIQFAAAGKEPIKTIVVTSASQGDGKSTTAANLAVVFANAGQRTLIVDADMRRSTVHKTFKVSNAQGLTNYLTGNAELEQVVQSTSVENLDIISGGTKAPNPSELLVSDMMNHFLDRVRDLYDIIILDMPPVIAVTDAQIMAAQADGTILVIREGVTDKELLLKAKELLSLASAKVLGVVYNASRSASDRGYYYYGNDSQ